MDGQLKRGMLDVCVLAAIRKEDSYGYQILKDLRPYVALSESTLYPILRRLETAEMLTVRTAEHNGRLQILSSHAAGPRAHRAIQNRMGADREHLPIHSVNGGD